VGFLVGDEFHLADLAVAVAHRRQGLGSALLASLEEDLRTQDVRLITLEVRLSNVAAQSLYASRGYQNIAMRKCYYTDPVEDALVMVRPLAGSLAEWVSTRPFAAPKS
jgi:ribosomal-protein-alanine N-acetyltransferase